MYYYYSISTVLVLRVPHRKWRESNHQLSFWPSCSLLGCSFVSLHFLLGTLLTSPVEATLYLKVADQYQVNSTFINRDG